ncbi:hypothetical protein BCT04_16130 [Vibrio breoganii]|uniref:glycosyltransferase n=1 Tax=Vibrio breoganii TaxID=553239 RepID=UPI000C8281DF|nr:glycosyltransferase [Vibrio breoganii]PMO63056.1 hypothetical protein BCT04_16130 [Vibrio breoganii]
MISSISFVIIGLNEVENIGKCISSVKDSISRLELGFSEILYVDSQSSDSSIEVAIKNGIDKVYILEGDKSASAARKVGEINSTCDWILFLDADMTLDVNFLRYVQTDILSCSKNNIPSGYIGKRAEYKVDDSGCVLVSDNFYSQEIRTNLSHIGGALLINKKKLHEVGGFLPDQIMWEESELLARLNSNDYFVVGLPFSFISHYNKKHRSGIASISKYLKLKGTAYYYWKFIFETLRAGHIKNSIKNQKQIFLGIILIIALLSNFNSFLFCLFLLYVFIYDLKSLIHCMFRAIHFFPSLFVYLFNNKDFNFKWSEHPIPREK